MRIETETPMAPSKFNGAFQENGAHTLAERITKGEQFRCIRYSNQVSEIDCTKAVRTLCLECATGHAIRRKNGLREPSWFAPIDILTSESEVEMAKKKAVKIITCPECKSNDVPEKARGLCSRCYRYVSQGRPVPPVEATDKRTLLVEHKDAPGVVFHRKDKAPTAKVETPEEIGKADDFEPFMAVSPSEGVMTHDMGGGKTEYVLDLGAFREGPAIIEWLVEMAQKDDTRTVEGHALDILRSHRRAKEMISARAA